MNRHISTFKQNLRYANVLRHKGSVVDLGTDIHGSLNHDLIPHLSYLNPLAKPFKSMLSSFDLTFNTINSMDKNTQSLNPNAAIFVPREIRDSMKNSLYFRHFIERIDSIETRSHLNSSVDLRLYTMLATIITISSFFNMEYLLRSY